VEAALDAIEVSDVPDGQRRLEDGQGSEEDVFQEALETQASTPGTAVFQGGDLIADEPTIGTLDAGGSFSLDDVVIDAPEAFGMRGDTGRSRRSVTFTTPKLTKERK
jgi:hypothetical protein